MSSEWLTGFLPVDGTGTHVVEHRSGVGQGCPSSASAVWTCPETPWWESDVGIFFGTVLFQLEETKKVRSQMEM